MLFGDFLAHISDRNPLYLGIEIALAAFAR
jgi:hypothetical protein